MKYNYCPVCGEELPPHHRGKLCKKCAKKELGKKAVTALVCAGIGAAVGYGTYYYVTRHKKEVAARLQDFATKAVEIELRKLANEPKQFLELARTLYQAKDKIPA